MTIDDKSQQHEPIQLNYVEHEPIERLMTLVEDEAGFRLIIPPPAKWLDLLAPIWFIVMGCMDLVSATVFARLTYRFAGAMGLKIDWAKIMFYWLLPGAAFLIIGLVFLIRETQRRRQANQLGVENGRLFRIRDGTWRTRRREISLTDVRDVRVKELRSVIPWRKEIEIAVHFRGRWQVAWRKRFGERNMALGRRFYELLVRAINAQTRQGPHPDPPPEYRGKE